MTRLSLYWRLVTLSSSGQCKYQVCSSVRDWLQSWVTTSMGDRALQMELFERWRAQGPDAGQAELSLRCFVSYYIRQACQSLVHQFGRRYGLRLSELLPFVLTDTARRARRAFSLEILERYCPLKSAQLSTWTIRLTKNHKALNHFLLEQGLYRVSDWAILNDTAPMQLQRILTDYHSYSPRQAGAACQLLRRYHQIYRRDRKQAQRGTRRCQQPTPQQLQQMMPGQPPETVLAQLQSLADRLRQYRIYIRSGNAQAFKGLVSFEDLPNFTLENWADVQNTNLVEEADERGIFFEQYQRDLDRCLRHAIAAGLHQRLADLRQQDSLRAQAYLTAVHLFHQEGLSMGAIAQQLTQQFSPQLQFKNQVQITRLMQLRNLRQQVRQLTLTQIQTCVYQHSQQYLSTEQLTQLRPIIDDILAQTVDQIVSEAAAEAQRPNRQQNRSWFSQQICEVVPTLCA